MVEWIWRQIGIQLPADWECLQYARESAQGRCAFADRHRFRLELNWRVFQAAPDLERMTKDYAASLEAGWENIQFIRCRGWPGLTGRRGEETVSRFGAYLDELNVLVEVVCIHPDKRDDALEARILPTVRAVPPDADGYQRWRAFGMDMRVPASFQLSECAVEPARVGMRFEGPNKPDRWIFRRYGMVDDWLKISLREWLQLQCDPEVKEARFMTATQGNRAIERVEGVWKPEGLLLRGGLYTASAWREPGDQRLYHAICITGNKQRPYHPQEGADTMMQARPEFLVVPGRTD